MKGDPGWAPPALYPIVDVRGDSAAAADEACSLARHLAAAGATLVQLRAKELGTGAFTDLAAGIVAELRARSCKVIVNDRVDVAMAADADGVHLGDEDLPPSMARALLGETALVGYSTHSEAEAADATALPVDYLAFGPIFESPTKAGVRRPRGLEALRRVCATSERPVVAIGGITIETAPAVWLAGAASVAVIGELQRAADPAALIRAYRTAAARQAS